MKARACIYIAVAALASGGCYDTHRTPSDDAPIAAATTTIGKIRRLCNGHSVDVATDAVVVGRVTTTDAAGNFNRSLFVEDDTGGIEIMAGTYDLCRKYPQGVKLAVLLNGCRVGFTDGVLQTGLQPEPYASYTVGYFMAEPVIDRHVQRSNDRTEIAPATISLDETDESLCGRLVRIAGLKYAPIASATDENTDTALPTMAGYNRFIDAMGRTVYTFVRDYADFADEPLPLDEIAVTGILLYGTVPNDSKQYIVKPRTASDYETCNNNNLSAPAALVR
ncbi:MAG: DUF5689 domain-containing protein [Alistipes sp.]